MITHCLSESPEPLLITKTRELIKQCFKGRALPVATCNSIIDRHN